MTRCEGPVEAGNDPQRLSGSEPKAGQRPREGLREDKKKSLSHMALAVDAAVALHHFY